MMKIAITGGTGFVGRHLAERLIRDGHQVLLIARGIRDNNTTLHQQPSVMFCRSDLSDAEVLARAFTGCDAIAHCAGINREIGEQTYQRVHIAGTSNVVRAAKAAGVRKIVVTSFLRARPNCGSAYHESKWDAEELVRNSGLDYTVMKCGMAYGRGDHMLDHLSRALFTFPLFATVGFREKPICPIPVEDVVDVMRAALLNGRLSRTTVAVTGAEQIYLREVVHRVAAVLGKRVAVVPAPVWFHYLLAHIFEWTMRVPLIALAQVKILEEGVVEAAPPCESLPADMRPSHFFTAEQIRKGLPAPGAFGLRDLRCCT
jgi:nucleoside-diphosphate-sugar epimerase